MGYPFRLLETGNNSAFFNMGLDEALLESVSAGTSLPTLRFYGWKPSALSIGYFQGIDEEIDIEACKRSKVDFVRRITGGGAVFHDAEVTYSIAIPEGHPLAPASILDSYALLCESIIAGLKILKIEAHYAPINDIVAGDKKISGNAQTRKKDCLLQHGTILLSVDVETMFSLLKVPQEKSKGKLIEDVKARMTSISDMLGKQVEFEEAADALERGFAGALDLDLVPDAPTDEETRRAQDLAENKFSTIEWNFRR